MRNSKHHFSRIFSIALVLTLALTSFGNVAFASTVFPDIEGSYAKTEIEELFELGIIDGMDDGTFKPKQEITRAEFAKILVYTLGLEENPEAAAQFQDIGQNSWFRGVVGALVESGITQGTTDTTFSPSAKVTRQELAVFYTRVLGLEDEANALDLDSAITDMGQASSWAKNEIALALEIGLFTGMKNTDGTFRFDPKTNAERQAVAALSHRFIYNGMQYLENFHDLVDIALDVKGLTANDGAASVSLNGTGTAADPFVLVADPSKEGYVLQFTQNSTTNVELGLGIELNLVDSTLTQAEKDQLIAYYEAKPEPYAEYLVGALEGTYPFAVINNDLENGLLLYDAAKLIELGIEEAEGLVIPGNFPTGTYTLEGSLGSQTFTYVLKIKNPTVLDVKGLTANDGTTSAALTGTGTVADPFVLTADPAKEGYVVQFAANSSANVDLGTGIGLKLKDSTLTQAQKDELVAYYEAKPEAYAQYLAGALSGTNPFAVIKSDANKALVLNDGAKLAENNAGASLGMLIPGNFPVGTYTLEGKDGDQTFTYVLTVKN